MNDKKWIMGFGVIFILLIIAFVIFNYTFDFYRYFHAKEAQKFYFVPTVRKVKMRHIEQNKDKYEGYILGGSKSGAINADLVSMYEGKNFYNLCVPIGSFTDYKAFTKYIAENTSANEIILHLGNIELFHYTTTDVPATITNRKKDYIKEFASFLFMNPVQIIGELENATSRYTYANGSLNYETVYDLYNKIGAKEFTETYVIPKNYEYLAYKTFDGVQKELLEFNNNLVALGEIAEICRANDIELKVIIGPTFVYELQQYEGQDFWSYLRGIASITDFWDFSGFTDIGLNPCNFINEDHYNNKVADKMINVVYGKEKVEGFGEYVSGDNFDKYITKRAQKFDEMKAIYDETNEIKLFDENSSSYIK